MAAKKSAAKPTASKKTTKAVKSSHTTRSKVKYTAAQRKAYQAASRTAIQKAQLKHNASVLQQRRLQGSAKARAKLAAKRQETITARIGRNAVRATYQQTVYAKQSKRLQVQAAHRLFKAQSVAQNRQFAYLGEAIHARTTTLQTLTDEQAMTAAERHNRAARKNLAKGPPPARTRKSATRRTKPRSNFKAVGQAAGRAAAARVSVTKTSKTRKAAGMQPGDKVTQWITAGNDQYEENCVAVALANHLLLHTGYRVSDDAVNSLAAVSADTIDTALKNLDYFDAWRPVGLSEYGRVLPANAKPGMIVGFEVTVNGEILDHCGVLMEGSRVVCWGEVIPLESEVDEAWEVTWTTPTGT